VEKDDADAEGPEFPHLHPMLGIIELKGGEIPFCSLIFSPDKSIVERLGSVAKTFCHASSPLLQSITHIYFRGYSGFP
jgi:hypothetical protein